MLGWTNDYAGQGKKGGGSPRRKPGFKIVLKTACFRLPTIYTQRWGELGGGGEGNQQSGKPIKALRRNEEKKDDRRWRRFWLLDVRCQIVFFSPYGSIMAEQGYVVVFGAK